MPKLKTVKYVRHEFHGEPEPCTGTLLTFVHDVPYLSACGVFPPIHILNEIFSSGGGTGGMSPVPHGSPLRFRGKSTTLWPLR